MVSTWKERAGSLQIWLCEAGHSAEQSIAGGTGSIVCWSEAWIPQPDSLCLNSLTSRVTLGRLLNFLVLRFLSDKINIMIVSTSYGCYKGKVSNICIMLRPIPGVSVSTLCLLNTIRPQITFHSTSFSYKVDEMP